MARTVRGADSRDLGALLPLVESFQAFERIPFDAGQARRSLARLLADPALGRVLLAEIDGRPAGYAILTFGYDLEFGGMDAYLTDLFLVEEARGHGHGTWLVGEVERAARDAGVLALHLMVAPHNGRAHHIYYQAGFQVSPRLFMTKLLGADPAGRGSGDQLGGGARHRDALEAELAAPVVGPGHRERDGVE